MSELSSEARALVGDARGVLRPTVEDRARMASRLARRLGAAVVLVPHPTFAAAKSATVSKLSSFVAALGLLGAGASYMLVRSADVAPLASAPVHAAGFHGSESAATSPCVAVPPQGAEAELPPAPTPPVDTRRATPHDRLAQEVELLSRATSQLRGGNASLALELLEQHRRQFPAGQLVEERRAARAQALCALGDRSGAEVELARLARSAPRSPHVVRAQRACGL
ncbi:MAG: hypothetical protein K0R38_5735 [Polyangiaceae bacterium]|jgi:hypothetical protein|nr:hypothetical protein [Polyangiaceae bacterium]